MGISSLATINFDSELRRAGAHSTHGWRRLLFLSQRYLLGTVGLVIMVLFVWMGRSVVPAHYRHSAGPSLAGAGAGDDGSARAVAAERDHRHCDPADSNGRPRDPRQYAGAARTAVRRGRQIDRHERNPHRAP